MLFIYNFSFLFLKSQSNTVLSHNGILKNFYLTSMSRMRAKLRVENEWSIFHSE